MRSPLGFASLRTGRLASLRVGRLSSASLRFARALASLGLCLAALAGAAVSRADSASDEWPLHGRTADEQRFSPLRAIDRASVPRLGLAWSYDTGERRGMEATPIVVDGVLYGTASWSVVYALDAATGHLLWRYDPQVPKQKGRDACCDVVNRGVALWQGRVYVGALDGRLIALDAATGRPLWQVQTTDTAKPYTITGAPRVVKGLVLIGNGGAELGVRGYVGAYDAKTGALVWRFYTVPASKEGPFEHLEVELAAKTWPANALYESGLGGTVWDSMAYDAELDLLYVGTGNSSVYDREKRSPGGGDNLFVSSILALRPDTGRMVWHYQTTPGDAWDYTATQHIVLADLEIGGRTRKVLMQAPKNGFFYVLDRATGELLSAKNYVDVSWATHVDLATGRPVEREEGHWSHEPRMVTPSIIGGHNWHPMSFDPQTGLVYIPTISSAYLFMPDASFRYTPGRFNTAENYPELVRRTEGLEDAFRFCSPSHITAWDPVAGQQVWRVESASTLPGGLLSTAGGLVFQGRSDGAFSAYDAQTGAKLWEKQTGVGIMAPPISYTAKGEQYVAVVAGVGGSLAMDVTRHKDVNEGTVFAWKLDGRAEMPAALPLPPGRVDAPPLDAGPDVIAHGRDLYAVHCLRCHGIGAKSSGLVPDLRYASREVHERWSDIVLGGTRAAKGMASFADQLSDEDARAIHAYVVERATHEPGWLERFGTWFGENACVPVSWVVD
ncbi:MAG TPA: PQQ-dependent dehydrogenase, methanol/ethanol family [Myxococcota bacterium]|nr:PQQ-dependent dehydrogenase, methanol/ethanol family [Myxococcota bacterium]